MMGQHVWAARALMQPPTPSTPAFALACRNMHSSVDRFGLQKASLYTSDLFHTMLNVRGLQVCSGGHQQAA